MKKTAFSVVLILLLLAGLVVNMGVAGDEPEQVVIALWLSSTYDVGPGQDVVLLYGWSACNRGLVHAFVNASNLEVALDGQVILTPQDVDQLWGKVSGYDPPVEWPECVAKGPPSKALVQYVLSGLEPGTHELHSSFWLNHPVVDGGDWDGDGKLDRYTPADYDGETVNYINVLSE
jgi:hypothetical protein